MRTAVQSHSVPETGSDERMHVLTADCWCEPDVRVIHAPMGLGVASGWRPVRRCWAATGAALTPWPWLALVVAGAYFAVPAFIVDRRTQPPQEPEA